MNILIEGWRGVNHSFALVNQSQILELLRRPGLTLHHRDLPFALGHWNAKTHAAGYTAEETARIAALGEPAGPVDWVYRICSPYRAGAATEVPTTTFMVTETGLSHDALDPAAVAAGRFTDADNCIVTPTAWSRDRVLERGFDPHRVHVVPHGVDVQAFHPLSADERRRSREPLGLREGEFVFLNLAAALWNKGVDLVLVAFATLRRQGRPVRLVLKDQRGVYGVSIDQMLQQVVQLNPGLFDADVLGAISVVPVNLDRAGLRQLYGVADCYLSPYRAEGFNLPVIESIACGVPVVVTAGGATDDFVDDDLGQRVDSALQCMPSRDGSDVVLRYCEPRLDALVAAMDRAQDGRGTEPARFAAARQRCLQRFTWASAVDRLLELSPACAVA